jgi:hypothetical protein
MTGIGAEGDPVPDAFVHRLAQRRQLLEGRAQGSPRPGGGLQQHHHFARHGLETVGDGGGVAADACLTIVDEVAGMGDHRRNAEQVAAPELVGEGFQRASAEDRIGSGEVD